jgi:predicted outer membrane repeat protein
VNDDAAGANDGTSWQNAYTSLQVALSNHTCTELWVAAGTYKPGASGERGVSFLLRDNLAIYGGFAGSETNREARDWNTNVTTLSGDLDSSSSLTDLDAYHVVSASFLGSSAILDGFTIKGGNANEGSGNNYGGGMSIVVGSPTLAHLTFTGNFATLEGGGMSNSGGSPFLEDINFIDNATGPDGVGGGLSDGASNIRLDHADFIDNSAGRNGGGMYYGGGGTLKNLYFSGNEAQFGGGFFAAAGSPTLANVVFQNNSASSYGGGVYVSSNTFPKIANALFYDNSAEQGGGLTTFYGSASLDHVTFYSNTALILGGGLFNYVGSFSLANSIFWGNAAPDGPQLYNTEPLSATISFTDIEGSFPGGAWDVDLGIDGGGNLEADPLFVDAQTGDLHLAPASPSIDAGDKALLPPDAADLDGDGNTSEPLPRDLDGTARVKGFIVDLGPYEAASSVPVYSTFLPLVLR